MKKFSKADVVKRDGYINKLKSAQADIETAIREVNSVVQEYNDTLAEAQGWLEDLGSSIESYMDEKSEKWQEGDAGSAFSEWKDAIENAASELTDLEDAEYDTGPIDDHVNTLNDLPEEPSV